MKLPPSANQFVLAQSPLQLLRRLGAPAPSQPKPAEPAEPQPAQVTEPRPLRPGARLDIRV